jgi:hypothetical protein
MSKAARLAAEAKGIFDAADQKGRSLSGDERNYVEDLLRRAQEAKELEGKFSQFDGFASPSTFTDPGAPWATGSGGPGDVFVQSKGYQRVKDASARGANWSSGPVDVGYQMKGTLLESGAGGPGGGLTPPYYEPGVVQKLFEPLSVSSLFASSPTTASQIRYVNEGTATSGAAGVAEGGVGRDARGRSFHSELSQLAAVAVREHRGGATAASRRRHQRAGRGLRPRRLDDLRPRDGRQQRGRDPQGGGRLPRHDQPGRRRGHPAPQQLARDAAAGRLDGQFLGGGPFQGQYGNAGQVSTVAAPLWGLRVAISSVVGAGTALLGSFGQAAHVWRRGGVRVEASNSHADFFQHDLTAIRAEERLALGVFRPFVQVTGLS